jgi:hypothetical protein
MVMWRGDKLASCWRGGKCKRKACDKCDMCPTCQCECDGVPRSVKHARFTPDGEKGKRGALLKASKPVYVSPAPIFTEIKRKRRAAAVLSSSATRKILKEDHVELSVFGKGKASSSKAVEYARDKAFLHGGSVVDSNNDSIIDEAFTHQEPASPSASPRKPLLDEGSTFKSSMRSLGAEMGVRINSVVQVRGSWEEVSDAQRVRSLRFIKDVVQQCCLRVCPDDAPAMMDDVLRDLEPPPSEQQLLQTVGSMQARLPKGSVQRSVLVAAMCSSQTRTAAMKYITPLGKKQFARARDDAGFIALGHELEVCLYMRRHTYTHTFICAHTYFIYMYIYIYIYTCV